MNRARKGQNGTQSQVCPTRAHSTGGLLICGWPGSSLHPCGDRTGVAGIKQLASPTDPATRHSRCDVVMGESNVEDGTEGLTSLSEKDTRGQWAPTARVRRRHTVPGKQATQTYGPASGCEMNVLSQQVVKGPPIYCYTWWSVTSGPSSTQPDIILMDSVGGCWGKAVAQEEHCL